MPRSIRRPEVGSGIAAVDDHAPAPWKPAAGRVEEPDWLPKAIDLGLADAFAANAFSFEKYALSPSTTTK